MTDRHQSLAAYQHRQSAYLDNYNVLDGDFDDTQSFDEEQIVNAFGVDIDLNEEADIKEAGHVW